MSNGEYIMTAADVFIWTVIGGAVAIVFVMFLWSIGAIANTITKRRRILKYKRRRRTAGRNKGTKGSRQHIKPASASRQREGDNHETQNKVRTQTKRHRRTRCNRETTSKRKCKEMV